MPPTILIVDDDRVILRLWQVRIERLGFQVMTAASGAEAEQCLSRRIPDVALLDLRLPDTDGLALLERIKTMAPSIPVLLVSAVGTIGEAVQAMKRGACDFLVKPDDVNQRLEIAISNAVELSRLRADVRALQSLAGARRECCGMIGQSVRMQRLYSLIESIAAAQATVLITGESGVGKELVARAVHHLSPRSGQPFIAINCAAIPENLLESLLFGHEKGAFTGADKLTRGHFELAHNGTLLLDEIGEMTAALQTKLLRVLQDRSFYRLGGEKLISTNTRILAATNRNIDDLVAQGRFRKDLFYRLDVVRIEVPALRDRRDDIPLLATHFLKLYSAKYNRLFQAFHPEAMAALCAAPWTGNVRELQNTIERIVILYNGEVVAPEMIPRHILESADAGRNVRGKPQKTGAAAAASVAAASPDAGSPAPAPAAAAGDEHPASTGAAADPQATPAADMAPLPPPMAPPPAARTEPILPLEELEKRAIVQALHAAHGNAVEAARLLHISTATIYRKIKKFGLKH
ncbi:MAG: hypothetical protein Kow0059_06320 [Candidatus Sumerlaeia bacterium]